MSQQKKVYGLIIPKKGDKDKKKSSEKAFNVFGDDQDSDEGEKSKGPVGPYGYTKTTSKLKLQSQMDIEKAMQDDPTVYEYDEIYDDIQATKPKVGKMEEAKSKKKQKPQYIAGLLKAAEEKKKENERRNERKVQKERDEEGNKFADKESFVTSAYKQKMLDMQKEAEEERRKEAMEEMTDVTKQKDLGGFYRYLYHQKTATETEETKVKEEPKEEITVKDEPKDHTEKDFKSKSSSPSDSNHKQPTSHFKVRPNQENARKFRKRRADSSSESDNEELTDQKHTDKKDARRISEEFDGKMIKRHDMKSGDSRVDKRKERKRRHSSSSSPSSSSISRSKSRSPINPRRKSSRSDSRSKSKRVDEKTDAVSKTSVNNSSDKDRNEVKIRKTKNRDDDELEGQNRVVGETRGDKSPPKNVINDNKLKRKSEPIDPKDKVYPHHNSPADIEAARKRYLIRKLEREKNRGS